MGFVKFFAVVIKLALVLALFGQLKSCTLIMLGLASEKSLKGIMSYSKYTELLLSEPQK